MKKLTFRTIGVASCCAILIFGGVIKPTEGSSRPAQVSLNNDHAFLPVMKPNPVSLKIDIIANDWVGSDVEVYAFATAYGEESVDSLYYSGGEWKPYEDFSDLEPMGTLHLTEDVQSSVWTPVADTSSFPYSNLILNFAVDNEVDGSFSFASSQGTVTVGMDGARVVTPRTTAGSLHAASVKTLAGVSLGMAASDQNTLPGEVRFDIPVNSPYGFLGITGLDAEDGFTNDGLEGVDVAFLDDGVPVAGLYDGEPDTSGLFAYNEQLLNPSPGFVQAFRTVRTQMGIPEGSSWQEVTGALNNLETSMLSVDPAAMQSVLDEMSGYRTQLLQVFNAPLPTVRRQGTSPFLMIVNPNPTTGSYTVQVTATQSTGPFGVLAVYLPVSFPFSIGGNGLEQTDLRLRSIRQAENLLMQEISPAPSGPSSAPLFSQSEDDPCRKLIDSPVNKFVTSWILTAGLTAAGSVAGGIAGELGAGSAGATKLGEAVGFVSGVLGDALEAWDFTKESVRFLIAQQIPVLQYVTIRVLHPVVCKGDETEVLVGFFNPCEGPLWGTNLLPQTSDDATVRAVPPQLGRLIHDGFGLGIGIWGTGASYRFLAELQGKGTIEVSVPTADGVLKASAPIEVKDCGSPSIRLWR